MRFWHSVEMTVGLTQQEYDKCLQRWMKSFHLTFLPLSEAHYPTSRSMALKIRHLLNDISSSQVQNSGKIQPGGKRQPLGSNGPPFSAGSEPEVGLGTVPLVSTRLANLVAVGGTPARESRCGNPGPRVFKSALPSSCSDLGSSFQWPCPLQSCFPPGLPISASGTPSTWLMCQTPGLILTLPPLDTAPHHSPSKLICLSLCPLPLL